MCLAGVIIVVLYSAASATSRYEHWKNLAEGGVLPTMDELLASLGEGDRSYPDKLLALDVHEYELKGEDCLGATIGKVYTSEGSVLGLSTVYTPDHRSRLGRFVLEHYDEILFLGELVAIAGVRENCTEYRAVAGEEVFRISACLYQEMVAVGDLPPIPAENARAGYAA